MYDSVTLISTIQRFLAWNFYIQLVFLHLFRNSMNLLLCNSLAPGVLLLLEVSYTIRKWLILNTEGFSMSWFCLLFLFFHWKVGDDFQVFYSSIPIQCLNFNFHLLISAFTFPLLFISLQVPTPKINFSSNSLLSFR